LAAQPLFSKKGSLIAMKKLIALALFPLALVACGKKEEPKATAATPAVTAPAAPAPAAATASANMPSECTDYLTKVSACVDKLSKGNKQVADTMKQQMDTTKASWSSIPDKAALGSACKAALDAYSKSATAMGC
jgi:hypothetical protein